MPRSGAPGHPRLAHTPLTGATRGSRNLLPVTERKVDALEVEPGAGVVASSSIRFEALSVPTFRWYWIFSWVSSTGDGMENVIRNVLVYQLAGASAPFWLGMMVFAHWVPFTFFSLYGGVLADRSDNPKGQIFFLLVLVAPAAIGAWGAPPRFVATSWVL